MKLGGEVPVSSNQHLNLHTQLGAQGRESEISALSNASSRVSW